MRRLAIVSAGEVSLSILRQRVAERAVTARFEINVHPIPLVRHVTGDGKDAVKTRQNQTAAEVLVVV